MDPIRDRSVMCVDRHAIINPIDIDPVTNKVNLRAASIWANTLVKKRIPQLFLTQEGLAGHVQQLQNELNRLKVRNLEGCSTDGISALVKKVHFVRSSVQKSVDAARQDGFPLPNNLILEFPLISDRVKI